MRPHERRATNSYPYFKLATWDDRNGVWRPGRSVQETEAGCRATARKPGRYRISRAEGSGWVELEPFTV